MALMRLRLFWMTAPLVLAASFLIICCSTQSHKNEALHNATVSCATTECKAFVGTERLVSPPDPVNTVQCPNCSSAPGGISISIRPARAGQCQGMTGPNEVYLTSNSVIAPQNVSFKTEVREFFNGMWRDAVLVNPGIPMPSPITIGPPPDPDHWDHFACDSWNNGSVVDYRLYHLVYYASIVPIQSGTSGDGCPQAPVASQSVPPFPPDAPTIRSNFRIHSLFGINGKKIFIEYDGANFRLQDDRNTLGEHFMFIPDFNAHVYNIAAYNGYMMYPNQDSGGGNLSGIFPGQITPSNCLYRIARADWILTKVPGAKPGVFYIENQASGDRLQVDVPGGASIGDSVSLVNPRGHVQEQWELIP